MEKITVLYASAEYIEHAGEGMAPPVDEYLTEKIGAKVIPAGSGDEAIFRMKKMAAEKQQLDAVIVDSVLHTPALGRLAGDALREARKLHPNAALIFYKTLFDTETYDSVADLGGLVVVLKPSSLEAIGKIVETEVKKAREIRSLPDLRDKSAITVFTRKDGMLRFPVRERKIARQ